MSALPPHPGTVTYVDGNTQKVVAVRPASELSERARFAARRGGELVPVVKVVSTKVGKEIHVVELGPGDEPLRRTVQRGG